MHVLWYPRVGKVGSRRRGVSQDNQGSVRLPLCLSGMYSQSSAPNSYDAGINTFDTANVCFVPCHLPYDSALTDNPRFTPTGCPKLFLEGPSNCSTCLGRKLLS